MGKIESVHNRKNGKKEEICDRPECLFYYEEINPRSRKLEVDDCKRPSDCRICGMCAPTEKGGHCVGHLGVLPYLLGKPDRPPPILEIPITTEDIPVLMQTVLDLTPEENARLERLTGRTIQEVLGIKKENKDERRVPYDEF